MGFELFSFFKGGVHPPGNKHFTEDKPIEKAKVPALVYIPLQQHIGAPCEPTVKPGDHVKMGQVIGQQKVMFAPQSTPVSQARSNPLSHLQRHMVARYRLL